MPNHSNDLISYLRVLAASWRDDPREDAELLTRFAETRDETAFATLVGRHGPLVCRTCRQILGNTPDAEDAFQTVFLAMARKAGKFPVKSLAGWLHRVARRTALNSQVDSRRRQKLKQEVQATAPRTKTEDTGRTELYAAMDEELASLPERLRIPLLLHYLEGKTQVEVARILGCSRGALQNRMMRGEKMLRKRLERRGLALGALTVPILLKGTGEISTVSGRLIQSTARASVAFRAGTLNGASAEAAEKLLRSLSLKGAMQKLWWMVLL